MVNLRDRTVVNVEMAKIYVWPVRQIKKPLFNLGKHGIPVLID